MVSYQIIFTLRKSVPSKNWRGKGFGGVTDGEVDDFYCMQIAENAEACQDGAEAGRPQIEALRMELTT